MSIHRSQEDNGDRRQNGAARTAIGDEAGRIERPSVKTMTTVLLDRDPTWLETVEQVLERLDIDVIGKTTVPTRALALVSKRRPDLLIAELETDGPELDAIACLRAARDRVPELRTIVFSTSDDREAVVAAFYAGASAYVHKRTHPDDLAMAIRQLSEQTIHFADDHGTPIPNPQRQSPLTRREAEILQLVAEGRSNADIAKALWVTKQTVKFHLGNVYRKLGVSNRTAAARWAHAHGLLAAEDCGQEGQAQDERNGDR